VGPRAGLDDVEKKKFLTLPGFELRPLGRTARSQSLYRLSYPGSRMLGDKWRKLRTGIIKSRRSFWEGLISRMGRIMKCIQYVGLKALRKELAEN
jgi:hypothetical protein